jgi:hypothetical protein
MGLQLIPLYTLTRENKSSKLNPFVISEKFFSSSSSPESLQL